MDSQLKGISRKLSGVLRHGAVEAGLDMDEAGWVDITELCRALHMNRARVMEVVANNNKNRLQVDGERIRCCQGHSLGGMPVTLEALEASWEPWAGREVIWHGTRAAVVESIAEQGILAHPRTHVHMAEAVDSTVGKRANTPVMLGADPVRLADAGYPVWRSPNGVLLVREVPPDCITQLRTMSRKAKAMHSRLSVVLGL